MARTPDDMPDGEPSHYTLIMPSHCLVSDPLSLHLVIVYSAAVSVSASVADVAEF